MLSCKRLHHISCLVHLHLRYGRTGSVFGICLLNQLIWNDDASHVCFEPYRTYATCFVQIWSWKRSKKLCALRAGSLIYTRWTVCKSLSPVWTKGAFAEHICSWALLNHTMVCLLRPIVLFYSFWHMRFILVLWHSTKMTNEHLDLYVTKILYPGDPKYTSIAVSSTAHTLIAWASKHFWKPFTLPGSTKYGSLGICRYW